MNNIVSIKNINSIKNLLQTDGKDKAYLYRLSVVSLDKITFEKHGVTLLNTFDIDGSVTCVVNDDTKVGTVTQKVVAGLISVVSLKVDSVAFGFEMDDKCINTIYWVE